VATPTHLHLGLRVKLVRVFGVVIAVVASGVSVVVQPVLLGGREKWAVVMNSSSH